MNPYSFRALEYPKLLEWLAGLTSFSGGRELALALQPSDHLPEVERRLSATGEALTLQSAQPELGLGGVHDVRPSLERAAIGGMLGADELLAIRDAILAAERWILTLRRLESSYPVLAALVEHLGLHREPRAAIGEAIGDDGQILDSASPELRQIRGDLRAAQDRLLRRLQDIVSSPAYRLVLQEPIVTQREGRWVVPVKSEARGSLRGVVHDQSASGATIFVEPFEVVELSNRWRQLQRDETAEIERVLRALSQDVGAVADALRDTIDALAELDLHQAKARLAVQLLAVRPSITALDERTAQAPLALVEARHPLLERTLGRKSVVPITLELGGEFDLLLITGPNTGGKTVAIKTIGLLCLMAQAGLFLPTREGSRVPVFATVFADIGDEQSIEQSLSTFSSHIARIVTMLESADNRSLVLLDELGAGTDPEEGSALARALLDELRERDCLCVATSHYSELKAYAHATSRVQNASVEFDVETLAPTYRLAVGLPGRSNALAIATRLGMPEPIVARAREKLQPREQEVSTLIEQLRDDREAVAEARLNAELAREDVSQLRTRLRGALREAQSARARAWDEARKESESLLADLRLEMLALRRRAEQADRQQLPDVIAEVKALAPLSIPRVAQPESPPELPMERGTIRVGSDIFVPTLGVNGTVLSIDSEGRVEVSVRGMRVQVGPESLQDATRARSQPRPDPTPLEGMVDRELRDVPLQLDLRGMRRDEAVAELDRYIHDAYMAGLSQVRIVHGRGTGAVRGAVRDLLGGHQLVKDFAAGGRTDGGDGATVVALAV